MSLAKKITEDMKAAMKAKDKNKLEAIRSIKSAILMAQTEAGASNEMSENDELKLLQKLQKQRKDSLEIYTKENREDLAEVEKAQLAVIENYLPKQLSEDELKTYISKLIRRLGVEGPKDMGKLMGTANKELAGKADGKAISTMAKSLLQS